MLLAQFTWMNVFVPCDNCKAHDLIFYFFKKKIEGRRNWSIEILVETNIRIDIKLPRNMINII